MAAVESGPKRRNNYKLLVDPELKKGAKKVYRLNGKDVPGFPGDGEPTDPRVQMTVLGVTGSELDLKIPRFKFDKHWQGDPPERDLFVMGLSEGARDGPFQEACAAIAPVHSLRYHRHPRSKTFLGAATVAFSRAGGGRAAVDELDGKIVGGCYLRAELDDDGEHLRKYLEPVLRKFGLERGTRLSRGRDSDTEDGRPRLNSTTESGPEFSESDAEHLATPLTPPPRRDSRDSSGPFSTKLYPFSSLHILSSCPTPGDPSHTPSSVDSGISLRCSVLSPTLRASKPPAPPIPATPPPLPPEEHAPPLPPPPERSPARPPPPPSPPPLPLSPEDGIEAISSDEGGAGPGAAAEALSPVSLSPPGSPKPARFPPSPNHSAALTNSHFDPSLGLQTLLLSRRAVVSPPYAPISPGPAPLALGSAPYEPEVEEISGDESPVMVYHSPLQPLALESVSEDEEEGGGDDMDVCSNDGDAQEVIEVNVPSVRPQRPTFAPPAPHVITPPLPHLPPPSFPPSPAPRSFFPPMGPFPRPPPPPGPPPPFLPPSAMLPPPPFDVPPPPGPFHPRHPNGFVDYPPPSSRLGPAKRLRGVSPPRRAVPLSQTVVERALEQLRSILLSDVRRKLTEAFGFSALDTFWAKREKERQKPSGEGIASEAPPTRSVEPYRRMLKGLKSKTSVGEDEEEGEREEEEEEEGGRILTPRKRLLNFKIPLVHRGGQRRDQKHSIVARRRLLSEEEGPAESLPKARAGPRPAYLSSQVSDISSEEDFSEMEGEWEAEEEGRDESEEKDDQSESEEDAFRTVFGSSSESEEEEAVKAAADLKPPLPESEAKEMPPLKEHLLPDVQKAVPQSLPQPREAPQVLPQAKPAPRPRFKPRPPGAEEAVLGEYSGRGLDEEDVGLLRLAMARLRGVGLLDTLSWSHHPSVPFSPPVAKRRRVEAEEHVSGCARAEGYYKIDPRDKVKYLPHHRSKTEPAGRTSKSQPSSSGRGNRASQRRLASVFSSGDISSDLAKYNQLRARKKQLKFSKSTIHNWGLFAMEAIAADEMVIEYVGEVVRQPVADERERRYEAAGVGSSYLFRVDHDYIIDATRNGNLARFINHCCDPNCYAKVISFGTQKKIVIYSKRDIELGEEITYDYKFPIEDEKIPCLCGAPNCRGTLN